MSQARHQNHSYRSKKLIFRELDRPFERLPKTTRESTSTKSRRACNSFTCDLPEEADQALQFQEIDVLAFGKAVRKHCGPIQLQSKWCTGCTSTVHVARWIFALPIKAHVFSFLLGQIVQGEPSCVMGATQPPAPLGKFVCNRGASPVTSRSSSSRVPFIRHRLLGGKVVPLVLDTSWLANTSRRKPRATAHPPRRRSESVRLTPTAATSIVMSMSETQRSRGNPSVPETPSRPPLQNSPTSVRPDLRAFVGIWKKSCKASARCTSMATNRHARLKIAKH